MQAQSWNGTRYAWSTAAQYGSTGFPIDITQQKKHCLHAALLATDKDKSGSLAQTYLYAINNKLQLHEAYRYTDENPRPYSKEDLPSNTRKAPSFRAGM